MTNYSSWPGIVVGQLGCTGVYKLSQKRKFGERGSPLLQMNTKGSDLADTREEIENVILKHNKELLQRKPHPLNYKQIHKMKKDVLDTLLETQINEYNTFPFRDYMKIVNKIYQKKKPMFQAFCDSTPWFKAMIFWILKKIYEDETIPEDFHETSLIALFKKAILVSWVTIDTCKLSGVFQGYSRMQST